MENETISCDQIPPPPPDEVPAAPSQEEQEPPADNVGLDGSTEVVEHSQPVEKSERESSPSTVVVAVKRLQQEDDQPRVPVVEDPKPKDSQKKVKKGGKKLKETTPIKTKRPGIDSQAIMKVINSKDTTKMLTKIRPDAFVRLSPYDVLVILRRGGSLCFEGEAAVRALHGTMLVHGYRMNPVSPDSAMVHTESPPILYHQVYSPTSGSRVVILQDPTVPLSSESSAIPTDFRDIVLEQLRKRSLGLDKASVFLLRYSPAPFSSMISSNVVFSSLFGTQLPQSSPEFIFPNASVVHTEKPQIGLYGLHIDSSWTAAVEKFARACMGSKESSTYTPLSLLVCGGKGVGKSSFCRFSVNYLLRYFPHVAYLEGDLGQSELNPPGTTALHVVSSPLLGPSYTQLRPPELAYFLGAVSPKSCTAIYLKSLEMLFHHFRSLSQHSAGLVPLVINTHGWVRGLGLPLLCDTMRLLAPTHIAQFVCETQGLNVPPYRPLPHDSIYFNEEERIKVDSSFKFGTILHIPSLAPREGVRYTAKDIRSLCLMGYFGCAGYGPLHRAPYVVPFNAVRVAFPTAHDDIVPEEMMYVLNATVVGLGVCEEESMSSSDGPSSLILDNAPLCSCVGLGIIRAVDVENGCYVIDTPVAEEILASVNVLLKGDLEIPVHMMLEGGLAPYLTSDFSSTSIRAKERRSTRSNLGRKSQNK